MKPDSSRHGRKCEPRASSSSDGLFQTFPDFSSLPADPIKTYLSKKNIKTSSVQCPVPKAPTIALCLMQGSGAACWLERAICIFYVTETCALRRGLAGRSNAQFYMAGFLTWGSKEGRAQRRLVA